MAGKEQTSRIHLNRYAVVAIVIILALLAILLKTIQVQLHGGESEPVHFTRGIGQRMTIQAPRGDIVDRNGVTLAYSELQDNLYLAYAGLNQQMLNNELLRISTLLHDHGVEPISNLTKYLDLSSMTKEAYPSEEMSFVFKKDLDEISLWQQDKDLFNLAKETSHVPEKNKVKLQPDAFYNFMIFDFFAIESRSAQGNRFYSAQEAWEILKLRYQILENNWSFIQGEPVLIARNIPQALRDKIMEQRHHYPGLLVKQESTRRYTEDSRFFSHIIGYVGSISGPEYESLKDYGYHINDVTGKAGVEFTAERYLHGENGSAPYGSWQMGEEGMLFLEGEGGTNAVPGGTVRLSQELYMQKVLYASLYDTLMEVREKELGVGTSAAAVMLDLNNGQVLAMGSIPSFQSSDFANASEDVEAAERAISDLQDTEHKPMQNRTISEIYAPASTFKGITAGAAIEEGVITPERSSYECRGKENIGYKNWVCYGEPDRGHGMINLSEALMYSCNLYFFKMGLDTGIHAISSHAKALGLGEYSGIDLPGEAKGIRPSPTLKAQTRLTPGDQEWYPADTCQTSIGQFDNAYTILQLARAIGGSVSNRLVSPHVIYDIRDAKGRLIRSEQISTKNLGLKEDTVRMVREGMGLLKYYETSHHTFRNFSGYPINVGAKTGTAEVGFADGFTTNALFVAYAPLEDPQVAIACIVEEGGKGDVSSNIARDLLDAYFGLEARPELVERLEQMEMNPQEFLLIPERELWAERQKKE